MQVLSHNFGYAAATAIHRAARPGHVPGGPLNTTPVVHVLSLVVLMLQEVGPYTDGTPAGPKCAQHGTDVPLSSWWSSTAMCRSPNTQDKMPENSTWVKRGQRYFVRDPRALVDPRPLGIGNVADLKPFLSKYAYSIALDVLAANAVHNSAKGATGRCDSLFSRPRY